MEVIIMRPLKEKVSNTLGGDMIGSIKKLSEKDGRSFSQYINLVLREHLDRIRKTDMLRD